MNTGSARLGGWLVAWLVAGSGMVSAASDVRLVDAAASQDTTAVRALVQQGVDVNTPRPDGTTALLWAAHWDDRDTAKLLLDAGAEVNVAEDHGVTPLMRAAENASLPMVELLLSAGGEARAAQTSGLTSLMIAAHTGNVEVVRALLAHGADVNAVTAATSATALMWAVAAPHPEIVRALIDKGADIEVSSAKGVTPLMTAAQYGDIDTARLLIRAGADVNRLGSDGTHALPFAIIHGQETFARFLLEQGANPNGTVGGVPALHAAAGNVDVWLLHWDRRHGARSIVGISRDGGRERLGLDQRLTLVQALLAHGADPNGRITTTTMFMSYIGHPTKGAFETFACGTGDLRGATPLWVAAHGAVTDGFYGRPAESSPEIILALLEAGADQHLTTDDGTTPFMAAAGLGRATFRPDLRRGFRSAGGEAAVRVLLAAGAEVNAVNEADFTALHGAAFRGLNEIVRYLVEQGADINARDFRGRTPFRLAEGSKQSFQFQAFPETAELIRELGADTQLGVPGTTQERADRAVAETLRP
jgi:ankyrin repeat protein